MCYGPQVKAALKGLWLAMHQPCSQRRLSAAHEARRQVPIRQGPWEARYGEFPTTVRQALLKIRAAQIDRLLRDQK